MCNINNGVSTAIIILWWNTICGRRELCCSPCQVWPSAIMQSAENKIITHRPALEHAKASCIYHSYAVRHVYNITSYSLYGQIIFFFISSINFYQLYALTFFFPCTHFNYQKKRMNLIYNMLYHNVCTYDCPQSSNM